MASQGEELLKRPLYVYDLPAELLNSLQPKDESKSSSQAASEDADERTLRAVALPSSRPESASDSNNVQQNTSQASEGIQTKSGTASCHLCGATFAGSADQRQHARSDWHSYNVKQRMRGSPAVSEADFESLLENLDESISGSDTSTSEDESDEDPGDNSRLSTLLKRQAKLDGETSGTTAEEVDSFSKKKRKRGSGGPPMIWFSSRLLPENISLGVYRVLFTHREQQQPDTAAVLKNKQLEPAYPKRQINGDGNGAPLPSSQQLGPSVLICMIGGGHFAAMIVSLTPEISKNKGVVERQAKTIAQKTFHRYTTRRKQGGAQSSNDNAKGNAKSAGAGIRRANEMALEQDIRSLLRDWKDLIAKCDLLFVRATGRNNRRTLFGSHDGQVLSSDDPRLRNLPFATRRATQQECMRAFVELTRVKVSQVDLAAIAAAEAAARAKEEQQKSKATPASSTGSKTSKGPTLEEEEAMIHTSQLQALIRRSKAPALLSYLSSNALSPDFRFEPANSQANHHASTPLHLAASLNSPLLVTSLLVKAGADPVVGNREGKPAYDIAGDRATRDAFRVARSELGESKWDWSKAHVAAALSRTEAEQRDKEEKSQEAKGEAARRKAEMDRLSREKAEADAAAEKRKPAGRVLGSGIEVTAADKREQEARGLTPEMRTRLERERRARAAEERMRKLAGNR